MEPHVSMDTRYIGAWHEVNARIAQRQNSIAIYVSLVSAISAAVLVSDDKIQASTQALIYCIPVVSMFFAFLNMKHELTISNLRSFIRHCENMNAGGDVGYNSSTIWIDKANKYRSFHDAACSILIAVCNGISAYIIYNKYPQTFRWDSWFSFFLVIFTMAPMLMVFYPTINRYRNKTQSVA